MLSAVDRAAGVVDDDRGAAGGQQFGVGATQAATGAGHDHHAIGKVQECHGISFTVRSDQGRAEPPETGTRAVQIEPWASRRDFSASKTSNPQQM